MGGRIGCWSASATPAAMLPATGGEIAGTSASLLTGGAALLLSGLAVVVLRTRRLRVFGRR